MEQGVTKTEAGVQQEAIAIQMGSAAGESAVAGRAVEKCALAAESGLEIGSVFLRQAGIVYSVDVIDDGPELLEVVVERLVISEGKLGAEP